MYNLIEIYMKYFIWRFIHNFGVIIVKFIYISIFGVNILENHFIEFF